MVVRKGLLAYGLIGLGQKYTDNGGYKLAERQKQRDIKIKIETDRHA